MEAQWISFTTPFMIGAAGSAPYIGLGIAALIVGGGLALNLGGVGARYARLLGRRSPDDAFHRYRIRWLVLAAFGLLLLLVGIIRS